jgi:hypothetical protein
MCSYFPAHYNLFYKLCITVNHYTWVWQINTLRWAEPCVRWAELRMCSFLAGGISSFPFSRAREYRLLRRLVPLQMLLRQRARMHWYVYTMGNLETVWILWDIKSITRNSRANPPKFNYITCHLRLLQRSTIALEYTSRLDSGKEKTCPWMDGVGVQEATIRSSL